MNQPINFSLFFEKRKVTSATMPYNFIKKPAAIKKVADHSFSSFTRMKGKIMKAVIIGLNCVLCVAVSISIRPMARIINLFL